MTVPCEKVIGKKVNWCEWGRASERAGATITRGGMGAGSQQLSSVARSRPPAPPPFGVRRGVVSPLSYTVPIARRVQNGGVFFIFVLLSLVENWVSWTTLHLRGVKFPVFVARELQSTLVLYEIRGEAMLLESVVPTSLDTRRCCVIMNACGWVLVQGVKRFSLCGGF